MASMKWGLIPFWSKAGDNRLFKTSNARAETLTMKRSYKDLVSRQRCVVVVEGFFEWATSSPSPGVTVKQPYFFQRPDRKLLALACLYDCWKDPQGQEVWTFTMITTAAAPNISWCHDRMPVILDDADIDVWLRTSGPHATEAALALLKPDTGLTWHPVPSLVNSTKNNSPECIQRLELRAKRASPSSSPQRSPGRQPRSPVIKQPKIESFVKRESGGSRGDESGVKAESPGASSPSSSLLPSLPPPTSPYRRKLEPQDRLSYSQLASAASSSSASSLSFSSATPAVTASPLNSSSSPSSSYSSTAKPAHSVVGGGPTKRKRDDEAEVKAEESDRSSKVTREEGDNEDDIQEQELYSQQQQHTIKSTQTARKKDGRDAKQETAGEPWDEDSFPYYLVDDPTLSAPAGDDLQVLVGEEGGAGHEEEDDESTRVGSSQGGLSPSF